MVLNAVVVQQVMGVFLIHYNSPHSITQFTGFVIGFQKKSKKFNDVVLS